MVKIGSGSKTNLYLFDVFDEDPNKVSPRPGQFKCSETTS